MRRRISSRVGHRCVAWRPAVAGSRGGRPRAERRRPPGPAGRRPARGRRGRPIRPARRARPQPRGRPGIVPTRPRPPAGSAPVPAHPLRHLLRAGREGGHALLAALVERGEHLAPPGVDQRQPPASASMPHGQGGQRGHGPQLQAARRRQRPRGGDADPQAGEAGRAPPPPRPRRAPPSRAPRSRARRPRRASAPARGRGGRLERLGAGSARTPRRRRAARTTALAAVEVSRPSRFTGSSA